MKDYQEQIKRIIDKLVQAKTTDADFAVFGASSHKYRLNPPIDKSIVEDFERTHHIELPISYKLFITLIGNGGVSYDDSGAGPFYGIYPFGNNFALSTDALETVQIQSPVKIYPKITAEQWQENLDYLYAAEDNDKEFEKREADLWGGLFIIGTQECTYHHALVLNGPHAGRIVNVDDGDFQKPQFSFEADFLDWYESWLDNVIEGNLLDKNAGSFGYYMHGKEEDLLHLFQNAEDEETKYEALNGLLFKHKLSFTTTDEIQLGYHNHSKEIQYLLVRLLMKNDYDISVFYLRAVVDEDFSEAVKLIYWYAKEHLQDWALPVSNRLANVNDEETFRFASYILKADPDLDFEALRPFVQHENPSIRSQVFYTFSFLKDKSSYEQEFLIGLDESSKTVIISVLQALNGFKTKAILQKLQALTYKFPYMEVTPNTNGLVEYNQDTDDLVYISNNISNVLAEYGLNYETVKTIDFETFEILDN